MFLAKGVGGLLIHTSYSFHLTGYEVHEMRLRGVHFT